MLIQKPTADGSTQRAEELRGSIPRKEPASSKVTIEDTLMGTDPPIEEAHPGLQPALVFASYPIVLIVLVAIVASYFAFSRSKPSPSERLPDGQSEVAR